MLIWTILGCFCALSTHRRTSITTLETDLFLKGCELLILIQIMMMTLLFLGLYTSTTRFIVLSIPWMVTINNWRCLGVKSWSLPTPSWFHFPIATILLGYLWHATPPPWMRDSLTYHLALAKQYAMTGEYMETDFVVFSYFPQGWQSILTVLHDPSSGEALFNPRYLSVIIVGGTAMGLFGWLKSNIESEVWAMTGAILYLLTPSIIEFGTSCYVQPWLTAVCLWLLLAILSKRSQMYIGMIVGMACSLKYSALILPILIGGVLYTQHRKSSLLPMLKFIGGISLLGSIFYIRNIVETGNPVFPMMYEFFGGAQWDDWRSMAYAYTLQNYGMGKDLEDYLLLPIRMFISQDMVGSFQGSLGVGWLMLLGLSAWRIYKVDLGRDTLWMGGLFLGWAIFWSVQVQQIRFFLPMLPLVVLMTIPVVSKWRAQSWKVWVTISCLWSILPVQQLQHNQQSSVYWDRLIESSSFDTASTSFLEHRLPENYPIYQDLNDSNTPKIWLVWMRGYHYYLDRPVRVDNVFGATRFERLLKDNPVKEIQQQLHTDKISHVVINMRFFLVDNNADYLGEGATKVIQNRFSEMIQKNILHIQKQYGPVWVYDVVESSDDSRNSIPREL